MNRPAFFITAVFVAALVNLSMGQTPVGILVDASVAGEPLKPVWSYFGYDECNYTTSADSRSLLDTIVRMNDEKVYIRTHFLLNSTSGAPGLKWGSTDVYTESAGGQPVYNWLVMDSIMDAITRAGAIPLAEISFMPQALTSATVAYRNSSTYALDGGCFYPPRDHNKWAALVREWAGHSRARNANAGSTWLWELWNEPNIGYFHGTSADYARLFDYTEKALHDSLPDVMFGGPHVAGPDVNYLRTFLSHCDTGTNYASGSAGTRLDYVGFHAKGGTAVVSGHVRMDLGNQLRLHRDGFSTVAGFAKYRNTPIIIGEADPDGCAACPATTYPADAYRNVPAYGAYEVAMMKHSIDLAKRLNVNLRGLVTWAWLFVGQPYFQGYRTLSCNGIHKPVLNAFKMISRLRGTRVTLQSTGARGLDSLLATGVRGSRPDIDGLAARQGDSIVRVLIWNYHDDMVTVAPDSIRLTVRMPAAFPFRARVTHYRMDSTHSNAYTRWIQLGRPQNPTVAQLAQLRQAMQLETLETPRVVDVAGQAVVMGFSLPRHGVSLVEIADTSVSVQIVKQENIRRPELPAVRTMAGGTVLAECPGGASTWSFMTIAGKIIAEGAAVNDGRVRLYRVQPGAYVFCVRINGGEMKRMVTVAR